MSDPLNPKRIKSVSLEVTMMERIGELKAEVKALRAELADAQESNHILNETIAMMLKESKQS
jgi:hypothetical protein